MFTPSDVFRNDVPFSIPFSSEPFLDTHKTKEQDEK